MINIQNETNKSAGYHGMLLIGMIYSDLLAYALRCDLNFTKGLKKHMVITCMDQIEDPSVFDQEELNLTEEFTEILVSYGDETSKIKQEWSK